VERKIVVLPWDYALILEWLRREAGQERVEERVKEWRKRRTGRPSKYPEDDLDVIKVAYLVVHEGLKLRKAISAVIGGKVEFNRVRYDRLLDRCAEKEKDGKRAGKGEALSADLRWFAEGIAPARDPPANMPKPIFDADELLKQKLGESQRGFLPKSLDDIGDSV
jgi:hypothetical protein